MRKRGFASIFEQLLFGEKSPPEGHEFYGNQWTGGGGGGGLSLSAVGGEYAPFETHLGWQGETARGSVTVRLPAGGTQAQPADLERYIRAEGIPIGGREILGGQSIEHVKITNFQTWNEAVVADVAIEPTAEYWEEREERGPEDALSAGDIFSNPLGELFGGGG